MLVNIRIGAHSYLFNLRVDHLICFYHTVLQYTEADKDNIMGNGASGGRGIF